MGKRATLYGLTLSKAVHKTALRFTTVVRTELTRVLKVKKKRIGRSQIDLYSFRLPLSEPIRIKGGKGGGVVNLLTVLIVGFPTVLYALTR